MIENRGTQLVEEYQDSGLGQREFCRKTGIKRSTLRYWLDRVKDYQVGNGAQASAIIYSIIETAKANHLNPQETLQHIFEDLQHGIAPLIFN